MIQPISVDKLVFKEVIEASKAIVSIPKVSSSMAAIEGVPIGNSSVELVPNGGSAESSFPWGAILIGIGVLTLVGVVYYQLEKNRKSREDRL
jgi:hypothetical protein